MGQTVTIDGKIIMVKGLRENSASQLSQYPKWNTSTSKYDYKLLAFGRVKTWEIDCMEQDVDWTSSNAKYLKDLMQAGTTVSLFINYTSDRTGQTVHSETATNCKVIGMAINYGDLGSLNLRYFTVSLQEAP